MPARLSTFLTELETRLKPLYLAPNDLQFRRGASARDHNDGTPRIAWVVGEVRHLPPEHAGRKNKRVLTRQVNVAARCWGKDFEETEQLVHDLIVAVHQAAEGSVLFVGEEWPEPETSDLGDLGVVTFAVNVPVEEAPRPTVVPTTYEMDSTGAAQGDGFLDSGES